MKYQKVIGHVDGHKVILYFANCELIAVEHCYPDQIWIVEEYFDGQFGRPAIFKVTGYKGEISLIKYL